MSPPRRNHSKNTGAAGEKEPGRNGPVTERQERSTGEPVIRKALTAEEIFLKQDKERYLYEMREKALWDELSQLEGAREDGIQIGRAEGKLEGLQEGESKALQKTALRLLDMGMQTEDVAKATGLSVDDVRKLQHH